MSSVVAKLSPLGSRFTARPRVRWIRSGARFSVNWRTAKSGVNAVNPGLIATEGYMPLDSLATLPRANPLGGIGKPEDIAPIVVFLASMTRAGSMAKCTMRPAASSSRFAASGKIRMGTESLVPSGRSVLKTVGLLACGVLDLRTADARPSQRLCAVRSAKAPSAWRSDGWQTASLLKWHNQILVSSRP